MKKVRVLLTTFNGEKYLKEQINSLLSQEGVLVDIVVNDDGSTDGTLALLKQSYPQIPVRINTPATGSAANNFLKMLSETDFGDDFQYLAFADQDDVWLPEKLQAATSALEKEKADLYCSNLTKWDMATQQFSLLKKDYRQQQFDYLFEGGSAGCTYVLTKNFAKQLKDFASTLKTAQWEEFSHDWLTYFFARSRNFKVYIDGCSYIHYRLHGHNIHGHLNQLSWATIKSKVSKVLQGYHRKHVENYIQYLDKNTEAHAIYERFLGNYFQRMGVLLQYNTQLMRSKKKFLVFFLLNMCRFRR